MPCLSPSSSTEDWFGLDSNGLFVFELSFKIARAVFFGWGLFRNLPTSPLRLLFSARLPVFSGLNQERIVDAGSPRFKPVLKRLSIVNAGVKTIGVRFGNHVISIATGVHKAVD